ncbi:MAG: DUF3516 domain-containing protein [Phycisphaerales bacterium]|nr:DUF3516 domain-containing protein [Phycisphaerales bacterium]
MSSEFVQQPPASAEASDLLIAFMEYCDRVGLEPYPAQERAFEAIVENTSVVLATPTGSGKSLVALAAHFTGFWRAKLDGDLPEHLWRSVYTAPIKALVTEKFFNLCATFGPEHVGLMTGDSTVNPDAPIVCCTAEILASMALAQGRLTPFGWVVMDEFHYYSDPQRGTAWLVPLLEMTDARFLLMSATLRDPDAIAADVARRTKGPAIAVQSIERPVPLEFEYREDVLLETIESTRKRGLTPAYVVSFAKRDAAQFAEDLRKTPVPDELKDAASEGRKRITATLEGFGFDTPFGKKLRTVLPHGIGVHHGGMLPKYRRLVERLASSGLITLISGTDTLGVGVNMPIRTVIFRQLYKYDGVAPRQLSAGEFRQIAGRAGRKGHDDHGTVIVLAPEHEVRNTRKKAKAAGGGRKFRPESPPKGFKGWNEGTMTRLLTADIKPLVTRFTITGPLVLQVLHRAGDGHEALRHLIESVADRQEEHLEQAERVLADFEAKGIVRRLEAPDEHGRLYDLRGASALESSFDRPLIPFARYAIERVLAREEAPAADADLDVLSVIESILDDPGAILRAQVRAERNIRFQELREPGQSIEANIAMKEELDAIEHPQPLREELDAYFEAWMAGHPHIADRPPCPKSVAREMLERGESFSEYVRRYDLTHDEHTLLYYLADTVKVFRRAVPLPSPAIRELIDDLAAIVEVVDTSVAEEWEQFGLAPTEQRPVREGSAEDGPRWRLVPRLVRSRAFNWVRALAARDYDAVAGATLDAAQVREAFEPYWSEHETVLITPDARGPDLFELDAATGVIRQTILDPEDERQWIIEAQVDLAASREEGELIAHVTRIGRRVDLF